MRRSALLLATLLASPAFAQRTPAPGPPPKDATRATVIHTTPIYVEGNTGSEKLGTVTPGREMVVLETNGPWLRVYANTDIETVREQDVPVFSGDEDHANPSIAGWVETKGVVTSQTEHGDLILFGEAIATEQLASEPHAPPNAAEDARRLYRMTAEIFRPSPLAPEALWRSADIRWQIQKADAATLPSAHEKENYLRQLPDEGEMKRIEKLFPGTKWADYAAYELIDNKLCGDWQGSEKCPEKEASEYARYAAERPGSPRTPQALYNAAWRLASAGDMWASDEQDKRAAEDRAHAVELGTELVTKYPQSDYAARGASLVYKVQQSIPIYGSARQ